MAESPIAAEYKKLFKRPYDAPDTHEQETVAYVKAIVDATHHANRQLIKDAAISLAMYSGRQWAEWTPSDSYGAGGYLVDPRTEDWQVRLVMNQIRPTIDTQTAKATENQPTVTVLPATHDDEDVEAARASESLVQYVWHDQRVLLKTREFGQLAFLTGIAFFKIWWDPDGGDLATLDDEEQAVLGPLANVIPMRPPPESDNVPPGGEFVSEADVIPLHPDGEPMDPDITDMLGAALAKTDFPEELTDEESGEMAGGIVDGQRRREGGVRIEVRSCFEVHVDPGATDMDCARFAFDEASVHIDDVAARWPNGRYCTPDTSIDEDSWRIDLDQSSIASRRGAKNQMHDRVRVVEYFERPSLRHPKGRYLVIAGNRVLAEKDYLPTGNLPFVCARHMPLPRRLAGDGSTKDLIPLQMELNTRVSLDIETANLIAAPKWAVARGSLENDEISSQAGEILLYDPLLPPPRPLPPPPMNGANRTIAMDIIEAMKRVSLLNDITFGEVPSGLSGRAIGFLSDQMASTLGPTVREIERALEDVAARILQFWRDYAPARKTLRVVGRDRRVEVLEFHASSVRSTDVRIEHNSMLPKNLNYKREQLLQTGAQGFVGEIADPKVRTQLLKAMEFGDLDIVHGAKTRARRIANEENEYLLAGDPGLIPVPLAREDHDVHIDELGDALTSTAYRIAPPLAKQAMEWHYAWHYYFSSMVKSGAPFWLLNALPFPQLPPAPNIAPPPGMTAPPPRAPPPPVDAFGPSPSELPPEAAPPTSIPPELLAALSAGSPGAAPDIKRDLPTDQPFGPGIGPFEGR